VIAEALRHLGVSCGLALTRPQFAASTCGRSASIGALVSDQPSANWRWLRPALIPPRRCFFRIVDVPAGRYLQPQVRRIGLNKTIQSITQSMVTIDAI
jgi:hypothetical protein